ncbi:hypothetical protein Pfo_021256 [Paulownia fortunei]|nr:hypothetical protein Pfo_021256 [Paulownia fortunei]
MASPSEKSSSSRSTIPLMPGRVVIAYDATKNPNAQEFKHIITNIQMRDDMIQEVDTITVLGVLHQVLHPMGFQMQIGPDSFIGTSVRAIKEEVSRMVDAYVGMLQQSAEECESNRVVIEVKIVVGAPLKKVVVQEIIASNATWVVLNRVLAEDFCLIICCDRHLRKELRFYLKHIPCKVALVLDNFSLELVPLLPAEYNGNHEQSVISPSYRGSMSSQESSDSEKSSFASSLTSKSKEQSLFSPDELGSNPQLEKSDANAKVEREFDDCYPMMQKQRNLQMDSGAPLASEEMKRGLDSERCSYSEIQIATNDFSSDNLLGEGGYGVVYKGQLKDGQLIIVKVQKEANTQGFLEFHSEVCVLSLACHKNIVMLLGYCCKENLNILIYEYICNRSLEWHLFDNTEHVLEWHRRHAIAIGIAKGLRFLHEECRGSPIIHRDMRPSNIFLTHEFVPLLADCGLAKWKTNKYDRQTKILGTLEYLAPEYAENGVCSVKTDVFAFGIVLIQLISGRKAVGSRRDNHQQSLRQWAMPLIQTLALDELVDPRLGDSYSTYELYQMARAAYLCIQTKSAMRPSVGEVLHLLEGKNDHLHHLTEQFIPHLSNVQRPVCLQVKPYFSCDTDLNFSLPSTLFWYSQKVNDVCSNVSSVIIRPSWFDKDSTLQEMLPPNINLSMKLEVERIA